MRPRPVPVPMPEDRGGHRHERRSRPAAPCRRGSRARAAHSARRAPTRVRAAVTVPGRRPRGRAAAPRVPLCPAPP
ncbi:hypothetical protein D8M38_12700 [Kocuria sp. HSID17582]|nr:hypothetical protein D8M38_12700 [Kocuria sp. HSID17582]